MHIEKFTNYLRHEKRYSPHTVISYRNDLTQFHQYLKDTYALENPDLITHFQIRSWMVSMMDGGITPRSVNRKLSSVKSYFKFLMREELMKKDPTLKIEPPKTSKRLPVYVDKKGTEKLLRDIEFEDSFSGKRDKLILEIFYSTGFRLSELINLKVADVDWSRKEIKVLGKGSKHRIVPVSRELLDSISAYMDLKEKEFDSEHLIVTDAGKKPYPRYVYDIVKRYLGEVTTVEKKSPHTLRHTFATHLVDNGADLNAVKELLGHASLAATQVYTHNSIEKLKETYKKAHPKA